MDMYAKSTDVESTKRSLQNNAQLQGDFLDSYDSEVAVNSFADEALAVFEEFERTKSMKAMSCVF